MPYLYIGKILQFFFFVFWKVSFQVVQSGSKIQWVSFIWESTIFLWSIILDVQCFQVVYERKGPKTFLGVYIFVGSPF